MRPWGGFVAGVVALEMFGCGTDGAYACNDATMCVVGQVAGVCQATGYCSFPDGSCDSGQRYGEFAGAGLADRCVPPGGSETDAAGAASTTGGTSMTTLGTTLETTAGTTSDGRSEGLTTDEGSGPASDDSSNTTGSATSLASGMSSDDSGGESSTGEPPIPAPPCADFNFEDAFGAGALLPSVAMFGDQFSASCYPGEHPDVVFYWVAPVTATYEFRATVDLEDGLDVAGSLRHTCDGEELACDDDGGGGLYTRIVREVTAGEQYLYVVIVNGDLDSGFSMSISQN